MKWEIPKYNKAKVNWAGDILIKPYDGPEDLDDLMEAFTIIGNWRSSHHFPLNTFQTNIRYKAKEIDSKSLVAQRIKRLSSIRLKLERFPHMKLSQMQDIAGCRAIMSSIPKVENLVKRFKKSKIKHKAAGEKNYIDNPKESGYRGIHLIYNYYSDRKETYNGLKVEIQVRTYLQHAWATAVETVGLFTKQSLKSSQGEKDWLRFFELMGTAIAKRENTPIVPNTPTDDAQLKNDLIKYEEQLRAIYHLRAWGNALKTTMETSREAHYYLLELDPANDKLSIKGYKSDSLNQASSDYLKLERDIADKNADAVLVSVESLDALRKAYPNYYADTGLFVNAINEAIR
jgi:hypothetical protein